MPPTDVETRWREIEALHPACYAWARACAPHDADDVLQAAYAKVIEGRARFEGRSSMKTWLFGVIRMTAREHRRAAWLRFLRFAPLAHEPEAPAARDPGDARRLLSAIAKLSERQREVIHLVFYEDLSVEEAAAAMGVGIGSARTHYDRGKKRLAELLREREGTER